MFELKQIEGRKGMGKLLKTCVYLKQIEGTGRANHLKNCIYLKQIGAKGGQISRAERDCGSDGSDHRSAEREQARTGGTKRLDSIATEQGD